MECEIKNLKGEEGDLKDFGNYLKQNHLLINFH